MEPTNPLYRIDPWIQKEDFFDSHAIQICFPFAIRTVTEDTVHIEDNRRLALFEVQLVAAMKKIVAHRILDGRFGGQARIFSEGKKIPTRLRRIDLFFAAGRDGYGMGFRRGMQKLQRRRRVPERITLTRCHPHGRPVLLAVQRGWVHARNWTVKLGA